MSTQGPSDTPPGASPPPRHTPGTIQPVRALVVLLVAVVVVVAVLARMNGPHLTPAATSSRATSTTTRTTARTPIGPQATTTTTTSPPATTTTTIPTSSVLVLVLNGWSTRHAALYYKNRLAPYGFDLLTPIDAATADNKQSLVFYEHSQYQAVALTIAQDLSIPTANVVAPSSTNDSALTETDQAAADVIVLVGEDISGKVPTGYNG